MKRIKEITISFLAALLLWSLATSQNLSKVSLFVDLSITNVPKDYLISKLSDNKLNIEVTGPKSILSKLNPNDFRAVYKMPEVVKPGEFTFRITPSDIMAPSGVEVRSVSPSSINIYLNKTVTKTLDIVVDIKGTPAKGYKITRVNLSPPKVAVKGPKNILADLKAVRTEMPFDVSGLEGSYRQKLRLIVDDKSVSFIDTKYTTIEVIVEPIMVTKRLENIPVSTYPPEIKTKLIPETFTADFRGPKNLIEKVIQPGIRAVIDIRDYNEGLKYLLPPVFPDLPPEIQVVDRNPKKITVKILRSTDE